MLTALSHPIRAGYLTQSLGLVTGEASRGAFLSSFTFIVTPLLAVLLGGARLKRRVWAAVLAAMVGVALLEDSGAPASVGDMWSLASAMLFAMQIWRAECWSKRLGVKLALPILSMTGEVGQGDGQTNSRLQVQMQSTAQVDSQCHLPPQCS